MSDEINAPSDGAVTETVAPEVQTEAAVQDAPASSAREALERAMAKAGGEQPKAGQPRAPNGQYQSASPTADALQAEQVQQAAVQQVQQAIEHPGLTKDAQALWNAAPEALRADVMRRVSELTQGMEKYKAAKADADAFAELREYADLARQHGTTLKAALQNYRGIEQMLISNPMGALAQICQNSRIDLGQAAQALYAMSQGQQPELQQAQQTGDPALLNRIAELEGQLSQFGKTLEEQRLAPLVEKVNKAAQEKPYFAVLEPHIMNLLASDGFERTDDPMANLDAAYEATLKRFPQLVAAVEAEKKAAASTAAQDRKTPDPAQTREKALKSITGSPSSASNASTRKPAGSAREALENAFAQVGLV